MNHRLLLFIIIFLGSINCFAKTGDPPKKSGSDFLFRPSATVINNLDSIIFDLANATLTATYIDIPVYVLCDVSTDQVDAFDYQIQFNLAKLTFSATIDINPVQGVLSASAFNQSNLFLTYTSASEPGTPFPWAPAGKALTKARFTLASPCIEITPADFTSRSTIINGIIVPNRVTNLDFTQFIPVANFNPGPTCSNANVQFANTSTVQTGVVNAWQWAFSTGATSTLQNPSVSYTALGGASSTLIVTTAAGCKDTIAQVFNINVPPVSVFSYSFNCVKDSVFFTNSSTIPSGSIVGSLWNFGDESALGTATNEVHNYSTAGLYTVTLVSISNFSCTGTSTLLVNLPAKVSANFSITAVKKCIGSVINFIDATTYTVAAITGWNWNFGDGSSSILQNPSHTYTAAGIYSVTLLSSGADGCNGIKTLTLNIFGPPVVQFVATNTTACAVTALTFSDQSTTPAGSTYLWRFGDGKTATAQNPANTYTTGGIYSVKLIVTSPAGCIDSLTKNNYLNILPAPVPVFSLSSKCVLININFTNNTTISSGTVVSYAWNFGDGRTSTLFSPNISYNTPGNYIISLSGTSNLGCVGTATQSIDLSTKPIVDFEFNSAPLNCLGQALSFRNLSTSAPGSSYFWYFGDNGVSALQNPVYTYSTAGSYSYTIKFLVTNPGGCTDSSKKNFNVNIPFPAVALYADSVIANAIVSFTNLSSNFNRVSWSFGDFLGSDAENPLHTFPEAGTYKVCLTAFNILDCPNQYCKNIYVGLTTIVAVPSGFTPNQDGINDLLLVRGGPFSELDFRVFNEWGNEVFSTPDQSIGWDGNYKGEPQPVGAYEYVMRGKTIDKKNIRLYGIVNLIR